MRIIRNALRQGKAEDAYLCCGDIKYGAAACLHRCSACYDVVKHEDMFPVQGLGIGNAEHIGHVVHAFNAVAQSLRIGMACTYNGLGFNGSRECLGYAFAYLKALVIAAFPSLAWVQGYGEQDVHIVKSVRIRNLSPNHGSYICCQL